MAESSSPEFHTAYAFLTGLLLTLMGIKYQRSSSSIANPFTEHSTIMMFFLLAIFVYVIALLILPFPADQDDINPSSRNSRLRHLCHATGTLACELLLLILVSPMWWFIVNVSSILLVLASCFCYDYVDAYLRYLPNTVGRTRVGQNPAVDMVDIGQNPGVDTVDIGQNSGVDIVDIEASTTAAAN